MSAPHTPSPATTAGPRIALVGAGSMGSLHARVLTQSERCTLVTIVDPNPDTGRLAADRHGCAWSPELDDLTGADAVIIAATTEAHYKLAMRVLELGKPLLVEKPVAASLAESEEIVRTAAARDVPLMCSFPERYNPAILTVLPMVNDPVHISAARHSPYAPRIRTGVAWDLLIHDVDACLRLVGAAPVTVRAGLGAYHPSSVAGAEDVAEAVLTFPSGALATVSASRIGQRKVRTLSITELDRAIEVDLLRRDVTVYRHVANEPAADGLGYRQQTIIEIPELVSAREPLAAQLDRFLDLVAGKVDLAEERDAILPPHRVVSEVRDTRPPAG